MSSKEERWSLELQLQRLGTNPAFHWTNNAQLHVSLTITSVRAKMLVNKIRKDVFGSILGILVSILRQSYLCTRLSCSVLLLEQTIRRALYNNLSLFDVSSIRWRVMPKWRLMLKQRSLALATFTSMKRRTRRGQRRWYGRWRTAWWLEYVDFSFSIQESHPIQVIAEFSQLRQALSGRGWGHVEHYATFWILDMSSGWISITKVQGRMCGYLAAQAGPACPAPA